MKFEVNCDREGAGTTWCHNWAPNQIQLVVKKKKEKRTRGIMKKGIVILNLVFFIIQIGFSNFPLEHSWFTLVWKKLILMILFFVKKFRCLSTIEKGQIFFLKKIRLVNFLGCWPKANFGYELNHLCSQP
jgi:hypothetical protein